MSSSKKPDGCAVMMRRTFLFLFAVVAVKIWHQYFSAGFKLDNFFGLMREFWAKALTLFDDTSNQAQKTQPTLPQNPIIPANKPERGQGTGNKEQAGGSRQEAAGSREQATGSREQEKKVNPTGKEPSPKQVATATAKSTPVGFEKKTLNGIGFYQTTINLKDPATFITIALANNATQANSATKSYGDEDFSKLVERNPGAVVINGTFFSKDAEKRVMGNMVAEGRFLKYSQWENFGTTFGLKANNEPDMITARSEGVPQWDQHWFSLTCGPRLLRDGQIWLNPELEGFKDPHVFDVGGRTAMGFNRQKDKLFLVTFLNIVSLEQEAKLMQAIGCYQAMNLDGGASKSLAYRGNILVNGGRPLTNVIVVYDTSNPAPQGLKESWARFQQGERPPLPV